MAKLKEWPQQLFQNGWSISALLVLAVGIVYANSFPGVFVLDDQTIVRDNPLVHNPELLTIFRSDYWGVTNNSGLFRPLTILSLGLNRYLFGPSPFGFHLVNVLLHAGVTVLLYHTLRIYGIATLAAVIGSLLFAVHPLHIEVVDVVVGRSELLAALFLLIGFIAARQRDRWALPLVCFCYLLALLSKEHAVTFLALLPLWEAFSAGSLRIWKERWPLYAGLLVVAILWQLWVHLGVINLMPRYPLAEAASPLAFVDGTTRILTALHHQWIYLFKLICPTGLQVVYSVADMPIFINSPFSSSGFLVLIATAAVFVLLVWGWRRRSYLALFAVLYLVAFLPTSNIVFAIGVTMAERLTYFPSLWYCAGVGVLFAMAREVPRLWRWSWVMVVGYVLVLGGVTLRRNLDYGDEVRLWGAEVVQNSEDFLGWQNLGDSLFAAGNIEDAEQSFQWMLHFAPDYPAGLRGLSAFYLRQKRYSEVLPSALKVFSLSQKQNDLIGAAFDGLDLAAAYQGLGDCDKALTYLDGPSLLTRNQLQYTVLRSSTLSCLGRDTEAVEEMARIDVKLLNPRLRYQYAVSLYRIGRSSEARSHLEEALKDGEGSEDADAWNLLGVVCVQQSDWPVALKAFSRAVELQPERRDYQENLVRTQQSAGSPR